MAAKVCRSVLLLSRSSGAAAGSLPALVASSQRHQQHIRPMLVITLLCLHKVARLVLWSGLCELQRQ
ncbi:hypothetical protein XENOCAPTIV_016743, partial [Xenoophorus captivus]